MQNYTHNPPPPLLSFSLPHGRGVAAATDAPRGRHAPPLSDRRSRLPPPSFPLPPRRRTAAGTPPGRRNRPRRSRPPPQPFRSPLMSRRCSALLSASSSASPAAGGRREISAARSSRCSGMWRRRGFGQQSLSSPSRAPGKPPPSPTRDAVIVGLPRRIQGRHELGRPPLHLPTNGRNPAG